MLGLIIVTYLALATLYATRVPPFNAPDEPAHFNFIRSIAVEHQLPILRPGDYDQALLDRLTNLKFPPSESIDNLRYESHQPPLYYLIAAPVEVIVRHQLLGMTLSPAENLREQVVALRMVTVVIGALFIIAVYRLAQLIFPKSLAIPLGVAAFVAFIPEHLFMDATIDNDALAELMLGLVLIELVEDLQARGQKPNDARTGIFVGLAISTKLVAAVSALLVVIGFAGSALLAPDRAQAFRALPRRLLRAGLVALVISGWWFARNVIVYGWRDPFGLRRHAAVVVGQKPTGKLTVDLVRQMLLTLFHSFWGQFGWMGIPFSDRTYDVLATASALIALGIALFAWRILRDRRSTKATGREDTLAALANGLLSPTQRWALGLLVAELVLVVFGVVFYNLAYLQPQGRYLFPTLPTIGIFSIAGIAELFRDRYVGLILALGGIGLVWLNVFSLYQVIAPVFAAS
jgi:hypothetical protein